MKLSKTSWLILSAGIFIVIAAGLGLTRSQQIQEQGRLGEELGTAEMRLGKLQVKQLLDQQDELQKKLNEDTMQLTAAKDRLRQTLVSTDVTDEFFAIAQSCGATVESISSSSIKGEKLEGISCSMTTINALVAGETPNLISLIIKLNKDFTTGVVKSTAISIPETADQGGPEASILMVVYSYEGD